MRLGVLIAAAVATGGAAAWFGSRPAMLVLAGLRATGERVPLHYQLAAFPAFGALAGAIAVDAASGKRARLARAALVAITGAAAIARLQGKLPLSGHALFLAAMLAFEQRSAERVPYGRGLAAAGLVVTAYYKVAWNDALWGALSAAAGALIGAVLARTVQGEPE